MSLVYCMTNNQIVDIFMNPLVEAKYMKLWAMFGLWEATLKGVGVGVRIMKNLESLKICASGGLLGKMIFPNSEVSRVIWFHSRYI